MKPKTKWEIAAQMDRDYDMISGCTEDCTLPPAGYDQGPSDEDLDAVERQEHLFHAEIRGRLDGGESAAEIIASFGGWYAREVYEVEAELKWAQVRAR